MGKNTYCALEADDPLRRSKPSHRRRHLRLEQHNQLVSRFKSEDAIKSEGGIYFSPNLD
jgi:hypothetical protein